MPPPILERLQLTAEGWQKEVEAKMKSVDDMYKQFQAEQVLMTEPMKQQKIKEIETKEKDLQIYAGGVKKADWDVGIAVDAIKLADKVDAVVLASGDGDFAPLLEYLSGVKGCLVEVMSFRETTSSKLIEVVDDFTDLSQNKDRYLMKVGEIGRTEAPVRERKTSRRTATSKRPKESNDRESTIYPIITPWSE